MFLSNFLKNRTEKVIKLIVTLMARLQKNIRRYEMKAIFETGGKQYYVSVGDTIFVEKLDAEVGSDVTFDKVLFADGKAGNPYVDVKVVCTVEKHGKNKKIKVFKYRPKKKYRKTQGHRQPYTKLVVKKIG